MTSALSGGEDGEDKDSYYLSQIHLMQPSPQSGDTGTVTILL